jgi:hypothetical protein
MYHLVLVDEPWCLHGKEVYLYAGVGGIRPLEFLYGLEKLRDEDDYLLGQL